MARAGIKEVGPPDQQFDYDQCLTITFSQSNSSWGDEGANTLAFLHLPGLIEPQNVQQTEIYRLDQDYTPFAHTILSHFKVVAPDIEFRLFGLFWAENSPNGLGRPTLLIESKAFKTLSRKAARSLVDQLSSALCYAYQGHSLKAKTIDPEGYEKWNDGTTEYPTDDLSYLAMHSELQRKLISEVTPKKRAVQRPQRRL